MLGDAIKEIAGVFGRRFLMQIFVPSLTFWIMLIAVWFAGRNDFSALARWNNHSMYAKSIEIIAFLIWIYLFSSLINSALNTMLRLYEGYWRFPWAKPFVMLGKTWHQKKLRSLEATLETDPQAYNQIYQLYPLPSDIEEVMPTLLGNILKNAELYPRDRYSIDSVLVWPRLYRLFPADFVQDIVVVRGALDFMLVIASLAAVFAVLSGGYLLATRSSWWLFLLCFWGGLAVASLAYRSSLANATLVGTQIKIAFDLYREDLLKQMRIPLPATQQKEKETWDQLCKFFFRNSAMSLPYRKAESPIPWKQNGQTH
jgi:hypothetical protein